MRTEMLTNPQQAMAVFQDIFRNEIKPGTMAGKRYEFSVKERKETKSRAQEERYHAMLADIAKQCELYGKKLSAESWKRLTVDALKHETKDDPEFRADWARFGNIELLPALNHAGFVMVGEQTRGFSSHLASAYIEWLFAFGAERNVMWKDPKWRAQMAEYIDASAGEIQNGEAGQ